MRLRMSLVRSVDRRELDRVANEKDRLVDVNNGRRVPPRNTDRVVKHPVQITLIGVQLHRPTVNIPSRIRRASFRSDSRDP